MSATDFPISGRDSRSRNSRRLGALLGALTLSAVRVFAQPSPVVTDEDIARARRETPTITEEDVRRGQRMLDAPGAKASPAPAPSASPRIDALPKPLSGNVPNLADIARGYDGAGAGEAAPALAAGPGLLVFVSLAMPEPTLSRLVDQAARAHASLLLRGFANGSLRETVGRIQQLIGNRQVSILIDPQAFDRYAVKRVPTFVLAHDGTRPASCANGACPPPADFVSATGDVSLDYALERMRRAAPALQTDAGVFLSRLQH